MKIEEANRIIAEFMVENVETISETHGYFRMFGHNSQNYKKLYTASLDRLVPVWDKINERRVTLENFGSNKGYLGSYNADLNPSHNYESGGDTIQEAAAIATAKAILELE